MLAPYNPLTETHAGIKYSMGITLITGSLAAEINEYTVKLIVLVGLLDIDSRGSHLGWFEAIVVQLLRGYLGQSPGPSIWQCCFKLSFIAAIGMQKRQLSGMEPVTTVAR
jgi:hypothetical protein